MSSGHDLGPLDGLEICPECRTLCGPCVPSLGNCTRTLVQECRCERRSRPRGECHPDWSGFDVPMAVELCRCCGRVPLRSGSRWSVWLCEDCKTRVLALNHRFRRTIVPIGRHSMMHGIGLSGPATGTAEDDAAVTEFCASANGLFRAIDRLEEWAGERVAYNIYRLGLDVDAPVRLTEYLDCIEESRDPDLTAESTFRSLLRRLQVIDRVEVS